jgi:hypothetical protein
MMKRKTQAKFYSSAVTVILYIFTVVSISAYFNNSFIIDDRIQALKIPVVSRTSLPDPIEFPSIFMNILGSQKVEPEDVIKYINFERTKRSIKPLRTNTTLALAAQNRADVIIRHQNFSHQDPYENIELATILPKLQYHYLYASENIGMGGLSGEDFVNGFMNSKSHRENLLNPDLLETGVGISTGPYKQYYVNIAVQLFGIPSDRNQYLGYNQSDIESYRKLLENLNLKLTPIIIVFNKFTGNKQYSEENIQKMQKQKAILSGLSDIMQAGEPFRDEQVAMVKEFNSLF